MPDPHLLLFDLYAGGHHLQYLQQLAAYWVAHRLPGRLDLAVQPAFLARHPSLKAFVEAHADAGLALVPVTADVQEGDAGLRALVRNDRAHGRALQQVVADRRPDHAVLMYFDHAQLSLGFGLRFAQPMTLSGIYFRPSFHYPDFGGPPPGPAERLQQWRKRRTLALALRNPHLSRLFCLDPYVVPYLERMQPRVQAAFLPDGFEPRPAAATPEAIRDRWGVAADRRVALFFGVVDRRKGIFEVLAAVAQLPEADQRRLALVVAGPVPPAEQDALRQALAAAAATPVQVIADNRFIADAEIQPLFHGADLALVTYQQHIGSSNVLIRAAAAGVPVLGSDYGLVGAQIRRRHLGLTVDATTPEALAAALQSWLRTPAALPFDAEAARAFAEANTATRYAATLFGHIHPACTPPRPDDPPAS